MPLIRVNDPDDPRIDAYRNVPDPDLLIQGGLFVAEGRLVVRRLIEGRRFPVRSVMVTEAALVPLRDALATRDELTVYLVPQAVMNGITGFNVHRGCLAIGERPRPRQWRDVMRGARRAIALERIANADNVGSVFRSAAAFGVDAVLLDRTCADPLYRKAIRTSMGAALSDAVCRSRTVARRTTRTGGRRTGPSDPPWLVLAMTPAASVPPLRAIAADVSSHPVVIVVGHEGDGLSDAALAACTHRARIPMTSDVDSLNVATATAIALV